MPINFPLYPYVYSISIYAILVYVFFVTMICERYCTYHQGSERDRYKFHL